MKTIRPLAALFAVSSALGAVAACGPAASTRPEPSASQSQGLNVCSPVCASAWTDCDEVTFKGSAVYYCGACGAAGQAPCDASGPDQGCQAQSANPGLPMGPVGGLCAACGDLGQPACDTGWQPPGATVPWAGGCNAMSLLQTGQPLEASGGTCVGCGLPRTVAGGLAQPSCSCPVTSPGCTVPVSVQVQLGTPLGAIGPRFLGLSYERAQLNLGLFNESNTALVGLFRQLGPGVLRIGAGGQDGVDAVSWNDMGVGATPGEVGPPDLTALAGFLTATGWTALYDLPLLTDCPGTVPTPAGQCGLVAPSDDANEAAAVVTALNSSLYGFEIGQEPEGYSFRNEGGLTTYPLYLQAWQTVYAAVRPAVGGALVTGPAASGAGNVVNYAIPFARDAAGDIGLLTQHYYRDGFSPSTLDCGQSSAGVWTTGPATASGPTCSSLLAELLQPDPALVANGSAGTSCTSSAAGILARLHCAATTYGITQGYRMSEGNSFSGGGLPGVSDSQAGGLWTIDYLLANAALGSTGVNLHGGGFSDGYTPVADNKGGQVCDTGDAGTCHLSSDPAGSADPAVRPDYYGMLLVSLAGQGSVWPTTVSSTGVLFKAYAVGASGGMLHVILVNEDPAKTVEAEVDMGQSSGTGALTLYTAPSLYATTGFSVGGSPVQPGATWTRSTTAVLAEGSTLSTVEVPPASAVLLDVPYKLPRPIVCGTPLACCIQNGGEWRGGHCVFM